MPASQIDLCKLGEGVDPVLERFKTVDFPNSQISQGFTKIDLFSLRC